MLGDPWKLIGRLDNGESVQIKSDFAAADDLLWCSNAGDLLGRGIVQVERSGRIGPLVEMARARQTYPAAYAKVVMKAHLAVHIEAAMYRGEVSGTNYGSIAGVFPLQLLNADGDPTNEWRLWASRADQAAGAVGFPSVLAAEIIGALGELKDNVFRHSQACKSGIVAFGAKAGTFEMVVSDAGIGVLASLRQNLEYAHIDDSGKALKLALANGESRLGRMSGAGFGMGQIFRALVNYHGDLRFRSGDHALEVCGESPSLEGGIEISHKAELPGFTVSVLCRVPVRPNGSR